MHVLDVTECLPLLSPSALRAMHRMGGLQAALAEILNPRGYDLAADDGEESP